MSRICEFFEGFTASLRGSTVAQVGLMTRSFSLSVIAGLALLATPCSARAQEQEAAPPEHQAVPRGSRPQGDNPQTGTAVPRAERRAASPSPASISSRHGFFRRQMLTIRRKLENSGKVFRQHRSTPYLWGRHGFDGIACGKEACRGLGTRNRLEKQNCQQQSGIRSLIN